MIQIDTFMNLYSALSLLLNPLWNTFMRGWVLSHWKVYLNQGGRLHESHPSSRWLMIIYALSKAKYPPLSLWHSSYSYALSFPKMSPCMKAALYNEFDSALQCDAPNQITHWLLRCSYSNTSREMKQLLACIFILSLARVSILILSSQTHSNTSYRMLSLLIL